MLKINEYGVKLWQKWLKSVKKYLKITNNHFFRIFTRFLIIFLFFFFHILGHFQPLINILSWFLTNFLWFLKFFFVFRVICCYFSAFFRDVGQIFNAFLKKHDFFRFSEDFKSLLKMEYISKFLSKKVKKKTSFYYVVENDKISCFYFYFEKIFDFFHFQTEFWNLPKRKRNWKTLFFDLMWSILKF